MLRLVSSVREISVVLRFAACFTLFTHTESPRQIRARVEEQHSCVQPKPTRSTAPIAKDVDAAFVRAINAINADKLKRYALVDTVSRTSRRAPRCLGTNRRLSACLRGKLRRKARSA